jgi:multiple sugar transport system permease protein
VTSATATAERARVRVARRRPVRLPRVGLHAFLIFTALLWLAPVAWAIFTSLRPYADTNSCGYVSVCGRFNFHNYTYVWSAARLPHFFLNSFLIAVAALVVTLFLASCVAFVVSRFSFWFNVPMLIFFMAANLLPQQILLTPLYHMYLRIPLPTWLSDSGVLYDSYIGIVLIHIAFQTGFCTFVLANYMKTIPKSLGEAARVDGASVFRQFFGIILPLCKPALAALATLEFTFVYNDFLWALVLMKSGDKQPITTALAALQSTYFVDNNVIAAGSILVAIPTLVVFAVLQRHFISGLTLGAQKG